MFKKPCAHCGGKGHKNNSFCYKCHGKGYIISNVMEVRDVDKEQDNKNTEEASGLGGQDMRLIPH